MAVVEALDLKRIYRTTTGIFRRRGIDVEAVRGVSFEIGEGELFGLLGPNGAGKTTTIKMLITLLIPTSGSASVLGYDVVRDGREVGRRIGYVFGGDKGLYERLTALDNLRHVAELYAVPPTRPRRRIQELLDMVGLAGRSTRKSRGIRAACARPDGGDHQGRDRRPGHAARPGGLLGYAAIRTLEWQSRTHATLERA